MIPITIYRNWDTKDIGYTNWHTLWHNDSLRLEVNSRDYRAITDVESDCEEVRERARQFITNLLNDE